ncbi:lysophospholipase [Lusitaniella coriacea LEGE 07157]|uniref:Lysophospholipase n=1 Tax=Lusitaniella coriacea LEGE 07157 TaxID=945747 RepID=A0A8J7JDP4_9CYAN|nr:GDSL-type esterase/lipase family protein [Lusitaniella coriacea]MBE9118390.1 lysophospholipase [Lusitaniella coriacea LEGE 07157]
MANGLFLLAIAYLLQREQQLPTIAQISASLPSTHLLAQPPQANIPDVGEQYKLSYQQWVTLLEQEAIVAAQNKQENLFVLLGDSISLWFPQEMLPTDKDWLNQGISGETTRGLLGRLALLDETEPKAIFIMIGINDLIKGVKDETVVANQLLIVRYLKQVHPNSTIILQSILPHSADKATWEGRDRLLALPNQRIRGINQRLRAIAQAEDILFLDLYPLFADERGNLRTEFSTDGLHLSQQGYILWQTALQVFIQAKLDSK